jgi:hypothetical protein
MRGKGTDGRHAEADSLGYSIREPKRVYVSYPQLTSGLPVTREQSYSKVTRPEQHLRFAG